MISPITTTPRTAKRQKISHDGDQNDTVVSSSDRLSRLPNHVVSQILSLLPIAGAFASRRLCRGWFHAWSSDQHLNFSNENYSLVGQSDFVFIAYVDRALSRLDDGALVRRLKLRRSMYGRIADRVESWLTLVKERSVEELEFDAETNLTPYTLPRTILTWTSLTTLRLANLEVKVSDDSLVSLNSLKTLYLKRVKSNDQSLRKLISSCRSLERLEIHHCDVLNTLIIRNPTLKSLEIEHYYSFPFFSIRLEETESLNDLSYMGKMWSEKELDYNYCHFGHLENVTSLQLFLVSSISLSRSDEEIGSLEDRISKMPRLETLCLKWRARGRARGDRSVKISGPKLKNLFVDGLLCNVHDSTHHRISKPCHRTLGFCLS